MRYTVEKLQEILLKNASLAKSNIANAENLGIRPCAIVQKQQDDHKGETDNKPQKAPVDGQLHRQFKVTIVAHISDNRRRDLDGIASTILDCLVATRRLLAGDTNTSCDDP